MHVPSTWSCYKVNEAPDKQRFSSLLLVEQVLCLVRWIAWRRQYYDITEELGVSIIQFARAIFHLVLQISTLFALLLLAWPVPGKYKHTDVYLGSDPNLSGIQNSFDVSCRLSEMTDTNKRE